MDTGIPDWVLVCAGVAGVAAWAIVRDALLGYVYRPKKPSRKKLRR